MSKEFKKQWKKVRLSEIAKINEQSVGTNFPHTEIDYIDISSVGSGVLFETKKYQLLKAPSRAKRLVKNGDTILSTVRPNRRSFLYIKNPKENCVVSTGFVVLSPREDINARFLYYLVTNQRFTDYLTANVKGAAYPAVDTEAISRAEVEVPTITAQHKIASILSAYDDLIELNEQRTKILEEMVRLIYKEWFVKFRFPGYEKANMVESESGKTPEGWEVRRVEEVVERIHPGKLYDSNTVKKSGNVPVLDQGRSGIIGYHDDEPGVKASEDNPVIVFANHTCYQNLILFSFSAIQNVLPFIPSETNFRNIFWLYWATKGLVRFNDYKGHWPEFINKKLIIPLPNICEKFGEIIRPIAIQSYKLQQQNNIFRQTRDMLLPKLLSGEIDVSGLDIKLGSEKI